jgi:hypothetical protein
VRLIPFLNSVIVLHFQNTASYGLFGTAFQSFFFLCVSSPLCVYQIKEGGEGQSTQLMLNDVIFSKLHVSAKRGHLLYKGVKPEDGNVRTKHVVSKI